MSEIVRIPFRGDDILTVNHSGHPYVLLAPALEAIGLDANAQTRKLRSRSWASVVVCPVNMSGLGSRDMIAVDVRTFLMLLATIDERRVAEQIRPKLVAYQSEIADVIERYWTQGRVINPRIGEGFFEPYAWTWDEAAAAIRQRFGIPMDGAQLTRLLRTAGVLKQTGAPRKEYQHLFWFTGSAWNVHPHVLPILTTKVYDTTRELQEFRFIQARLELEGVGSPAELGQR